MHKSGWLTHTNPLEVSVVIPLLKILYQEVIGHSLMYVTLLRPLNIPFCKN